MSWAMEFVLRGKTLQILWTEEDKSIPENKLIFWGVMSNTFDYLTS